MIFQLMRRPRNGLIAWPADPTRRSCDAAVGHQRAPPCPLQDAADDGRVQPEHEHATAADRDGRERERDRHLLPDGPAPRGQSPASSD